MAEGNQIRSVLEINAWLGKAGAGETLVYAVANFLPTGAKGPAYARDLHAKGLVSLRRVRRADRDFDFIMKRTDTLGDWQAPSKALGASAGRMGVAKMATAAESRAAMAAIEHAVALGQPCPTLDQLREAMGDVGVKCVRRTLETLERTGAIVIASVRAPAGPPVRQVTILRSGRATALRWAMAA